MSDIILNKISILMLSNILSNSSENFRPYIFFILDNYCIFQLFTLYGSTQYGGCMTSLSIKNLYYLKFSGMLDNILDNISYIHTAFKSYFLLESLYVKLLLDIVEYIFYMIEVWTPWWYVKLYGTNTF